ncbi:MAG TPA: stage 0 sporulation family protein [Clostridiaceae bacterium]|nr:stage 0 sporulation family protein [Clostridiaceae bacterium]
MNNLVSVQLHGQARYYQAGAGDLILKQGDAVIVEDEQGTAFAYVMVPPYKIDTGILKHEPMKILRQATAEDFSHFEDNCRQETEALKIAKERVEHHGLEMHLISAYYPFDNHKLLFYFTADGRIDFRELVRDLASIFHTRIELRQIGVRDEAGMIGGLGVCGRELCCSSFLKSFLPVSIRMAKDQNLSMNPAKISGACGRLLCCLNYEQEAYLNAAQRLPGKNAKIRYQGEIGIIESVNLLKETVQVKFDREDEPVILQLKVVEIDVISDPSKKKQEANKKKSKVKSFRSRQSKSLDKKDKLKLRLGKKDKKILGKKIKLSKRNKPESTANT